MQCPVCRAPVDPAALAPSLSMLPVIVSKPLAGTVAATDMIDSGDEDSGWLAAQGMAQLRISQRRYAEGIEKQRLAVRLMTCCIRTCISLVSRVPGTIL